MGDPEGEPGFWPRDKIAGPPYSCADDTAVDGAASDCAVSDCAISDSTQVSNKVVRIKSRMIGSGNV